MAVLVGKHRLRLFDFGLKDFEEEMKKREDARLKMEKHIKTTRNSGSEVENGKAYQRKS